MLSLDKSSVEVFPYDKTWALEFAKGKEILKEILKDFDVQININKNLSTHLVFVQYN